MTVSTAKEFGSRGPTGTFDTPTVWAHEIWGVGVGVGGEQAASINHRSTVSSEPQLPEFSSHAVCIALASLLLTSCEVSNLVNYEVRVFKGFVTLSISSLLIAIVGWQLE